MCRSGTGLPNGSFAVSKRDLPGNISVRAYATPDEYSPSGCTGITTNRRTKRWATKARLSCAQNTHDASLDLRGALQTVDKGKGQANFVVFLEKL